MARRLCVCLCVTTEHMHRPNALIIEARSIRSLLLPDAAISGIFGSTHNTLNATNSPPTHRDKATHGVVRLPQPPATAVRNRGPPRLLPPAADGVSSQLDFMTTSSIDDGTGTTMNNASPPTQPKPISPTHTKGSTGPPAAPAPLPPPPPPRASAAASWAAPRSSGCRRPRPPPRGAGGTGPTRWWMWRLWAGGSAGWPLPWPLSA